MDDVRRWTVPGRINLIGEHLDHNGGPTLPMAIDRAVTVKARPRTDRTVNVWSGGRRTSFTLDVAPGDVTDDFAYVAGAVWAAADAGLARHGLDLVLESTLPAGAGLASSAAVTSGTVLALSAGLDVSRTDLAALAQRAERDFVGVPVGRMDQLAVLCSEAGAALLIDHAAEPPTTTPVPVTWSDDGLALVVIDTHVRHALADGEYATRAAECAQARDALGLAHLAAAGVDAVLRLDDPALVARTRHVVTETARVRGAVNALRTASWTQFGTMLTASHASLRDDFEVSCPELDQVVETSLVAGALGARMTGGGFGGSAIALVPVDAVDALRSRVTAAQVARDWPAPDVFVVRPSAGATLDG